MVNKNPLPSPDIAKTVAISPNKQFLFYGSSNYGSTRVYSTRINANNTLSSLGVVYPGGSYSYINSLKVTPDNKYLLVGYNVGPFFKMYSIGTDGELTHIPTTHLTFAGPVKRMALSVDGKYLTVGLGNTVTAIQFFKINNGTITELTRLTNQSSGLVSTNVAISDDGVYSGLIYANASGVKVYKQINDIITAYPITFSAFNTTNLYGIAINSNGSYMVLNTQSTNEFKLFKNTGSGFTLIHTLNINSGASMSLRFFEDDTTLLSSSGYTIRVIKIINDQLVHSYNIIGSDNTIEEFGLA